VRVATGISAGERNLNYGSLIAAVIGNALEWYDFGVYSYLAVTLASLFFPATVGWTSLLSTLAIFGVAFFVRPFGGIVLGHYADVIGRKSILTSVIGMMSLGTAMIAFAPSYAMIGIAAPLIILSARMLQGLSAGGEFGSAASFLIEHAGPRRRGLYGAWQFSGQGSGMLLSGVIGTFLAGSLTQAQLESWGWRVPFLIGLVIGPIGVYMRFKLVETPVFLRHRAASGAHPLPIASAFTDYKGRMLVGLGLVAGGTAAFYVLFFFMPTYVIRVLELDVATSFIAPAVAGLTLTICCPIMGHLSDRLGRKPVMATAAAVLLVVLYPVFAWLQARPSAMTLAAAELLFGILISAYVGPASAAVAEIFPVGIRATAISIVYNMGVLLFGGFAPLIVASLIVVTNDPLAPAYYVAGCLLISLAAVTAIPTGSSPDTASGTADE
jgi:MFS transporter, MHS family, proline/betaine transporter